MKKNNRFKILSILSYGFIMLRGEMIALPFFLFLIFSLFEIGTLKQGSAILAFIGLISVGNLTVLKLTKWTLLLEIIAFILLFMPLLDRLTDVPIKLFFYVSFIIPFIGFIVFYTISLFFSFKELKNQQKV
jgi:hypothetical protein